MSKFKLSTNGFPPTGIEHKPLRCRFNALPLSYGSSCYTCTIKQQPNYCMNVAEFVHTLDERGEAREFFKFETKSRVSLLLIRLDDKINKKISKFETPFIESAILYGSQLPHTEVKTYIVSDGESSRKSFSH